MKSIAVIYVVVITCGLTHSYSTYGGAKRRSNMIAPVMPIFSQVSPQYYDTRAAAASSVNNYLQSQPPQYLSVPYLQQQQQQPAIADEYNYRQNPNYFYYPQEREQQPQQQQQQQQQQYQEPLYGIPTYHGEYQPKPYYFAQPSYMSQDDRLETTNPLDYLHEEILQENERERNNVAFMQNLALYNKQLDSLQSRQQQLQQIQDLYNLKSNSEFDDYDLDQPSDWYDQTSILVDPNTYESYVPQQQQFQQQYLSQRTPDYDDEMVKELKNLKQNRKSKAMRGYEVPRQQQKQQKQPQLQQQQQQRYYSNQDMDWQQDMPSQDIDSEIEPDHYDESYDEDQWINWGGQKRSIQPKKDFADGKQSTEQPLTFGKQSKQQMKVSASTSAPPTTTTTSTTTENSKLLNKLHKGGQKEVFLPRPATPVRRPFSESIMKSLNKVSGSSSGESESEQAGAAPPIYKTIKQIIDMEQNLSHLSDNQLPTSKIRKRFVTNEEALAQQLNGLKRTSK